MSAANNAVVRRLISERYERRQLAQCRSPDGMKQNPGTHLPGFHPGYRLSRKEVHQQK